MSVSLPAWGLSDRIVEFFTEVGICAAAISTNRIMKNKIQTIGQLKRIIPAHNE
jgi:hypothetical protein